jgi:hypothetical protein
VFRLILRSKIERQLVAEIEIPFVGNRQVPVAVMNIFGNLFFFIDHSGIAGDPKDLPCLSTDVGFIIQEIT